MNGGIEQPLPPTLRGLPIARVFLDVRYEARVEDRFAIVPGVESAIQVEVGTIKVQIRESGHALQRGQPLWQEHRICFVDWCYRNRRQHESVVVDDREDFFALLVFVAGIADPGGVAHPLAQMPPPRLPHADASSAAESCSCSHRA